MSRPPRFRTRATTTGNPLPGQRALDYLPSEFADFVDRQRGLAAEELGFPPSTAEGDFAGTLMELSALVAHVLGVYQDTYAGEAFLSTAQSQKSLVRHGRRLGYEPSPGLSATGHLVLTVKPGLRGTIRAGFAVSSSPVGEKKAEDYETLDDVDVDADHNELLSDATLEPKALAGAAAFEVSGTGLGLEPGEIVVVQAGSGGFLTSSVSVSAHEITAVSEDEAGETTSLGVKPPLPAASFGAGAVLLARPKSRLHLFAWDSSPESFPDAKLAGRKFPGNPSVNAVAYGYEVSPSYSDDDIYLAGELASPVLGTPVVRLDGGAMTALKVKGEAPRSVLFKRVEHLQVPDPAEPTNTSKKVDLYPTITVSRTVTALVVQDGAGAQLSRLSQPIRTSQWLLDWSLAAPLVTTQPSTAPVAFPVTLDRAVPGLAPGQLIALCTLEGASAAVAEIARLTTIGKDEGGRTQVSWQMVEPASSATPWRLGALRLRGNVVRVSHGKAVSEVIGDSDGVTPFLRFALKQKPLTYVPGPDGGAPALDVRVGGVRWARVVDFERSTPHDRHYLVQRDESGASHVVFGDGVKGAIPGQGKKHIVADYRTGVGRGGNAGAGSVSRIKKSHPLLEKAENPRPVQGGADPAALEHVRTQATGYIRTFGRAVSVADHRDLALLYPGIAKANAVWTELAGTGVEGVRVIVADREGNAPAVEPLRAFLDARRDDTVPLDIAGAVAVGLHLRVDLEVDPDFDVELVRQAVRDALCRADEDAPGLFAFAGRGLGQPAFLSEVYERILAVAGVTFVEVWHLDTLSALEEGAPVRVVDTLVARPEEWLELRPEHLGFAPASAEAS
ncbi:hypothetical protein [Sorangium cellulosum]|uniref:Baseplate protein J-like domain-containing protein n=1 Tax=Sorangium cellulosum So0157-2 TaxID=1254432 RepID=S4Y7T8_SORCE|nr:hypothetical protein [Sorangium cellulosum]AGP41497.1 hypothetical protein SCE1572_47645 [Sorangium cellulosum So0157-2]